MKKFDTILKGYYRLLSEQDPGMGAAAPVDPAIAGDPAAAPPDPAAAATPPEKPEPEVQKLSPEAEVVLVQFIRKALLLDLSLQDKSKLLSLIPSDEEITELNAKSILEALTEIIKGYSVDESDAQKDKEQLNTPV